jgi:hypothetical protein
MIGALCAHCSNPAQPATPDAGQDSSQDAGSSGDGDADGDVDGDAGVPTDGGVECTEDDTFLSDRVYFRTALRSFNTRWYVALDGGQIWVKPNEETGGTGDWRLLGSTGMPKGPELVNFGPPESIVEISADGVHLMALSNAGVFYRGSDMTTNIHGLFNWTDRWGGIGAVGDGMRQEFSTDFGWSVSDSHPLGVAHYEDSNGTRHSVGLGVAHIYRLGPEGLRIFFNDWWLPNDWSRQICGPARGTFRAVNISASASTMFVIGERGDMYTRLYDFDTGGENRTLEYSYIITKPTGTTRRLPAEAWLRQPDIETGLVTRRITIFQNGKGNAARVLRVEGVRQGVGGFFYKGIEDSEWEFQETGRIVCGPFLNDPVSDIEPSPPVEPADQRLVGTFSQGGLSIGIVLEDFNMVCGPARALLTYAGEPVTLTTGGPLLLDFYHVHTWVSDNRPMQFWDTGIPAFVQAALLVPEGLDEIENAEARRRVQNLLGSRRVINFLGDVLPGRVELSEIMWSEPFRVPGDEKGFLTPFRLHLGP